MLLDSAACRQRDQMNSSEIEATIRTAFRGVRLGDGCSLCGGGLKSGTKQAHAGFRQNPDAERAGGGRADVYHGTVFGRIPGGAGKAPLKKAAFFCDGGQDDVNLRRVFDASRRARLEAQVDLYPGVVTARDFEEHAPRLGDLEVIFATWGMPVLSPAQFDRLPALRAVFYAAGSVRHFAPPLLERGVLVVSAWAANAVPVAEFTLAQILLANKGYFRNVPEYHGAGHPRSAFRGRGNFGATVALLGAGQIGRALIELLRPFRLRVLVFDPFLSREDAESLGVEKVGLDDAFARGDVVSNHLANVPATVGLLHGAHFAAMPANATFINTGRGATMVEADLARVLLARPDLTALLDVTDQEPPAPDSPLWSLPNVHLSSHIAGSLGDEVARMADYVLDEFEAWEAGRPLRYAVTPERLEHMA